MMNQTKTNNFLRNIKIHYLFTAIKSFDTTQGIWMLYLASKGLSLFELGLVEGIFHITSLLMETPTGVVADLFGRKISRLVALLFGIISSIVIIISNQFWWLAFGFVLSALSYNFESGADEALVYDSLKQENQESKYMRVAGNTEIIFQVARVFGLVIGGGVGTIAYENAYYISIGLSILALATGLFFREPTINDAQKQENAKKSLGTLIKDQYRTSFKAIRSNRRLTYIIFLTSIIFATATVSFYYLQIGWEKMALTPLVIGVYLASASILAAIAASLAQWIDKRFGAKKILKSFPFIVALTILSMFYIEWAVIPFCILSFVEAIVFVASRDYLNQMIESAQRATILSFASMVYSIVMIALFPIFGYLSDQIQMKNTFLLLGGMILILSLFNLRSNDL